jgi:hypothetical protein
MAWITDQRDLKGFWAISLTFRSLAEVTRRRAIAEQRHALERGSAGGGPFPVTIKPCPAQFRHLISLPERFSTIPLPLQIEHI